MAIESSVTRIVPESPTVETWLFVAITFSTEKPFGHSVALTCADGVELAAVCVVAE
jgi:hypothetical protein